MNRNRIVSFAVITLAMLLILGQGLSGGAKAAPQSGIQASVSARMVQSSSANAAANKPGKQSSASKPGAASPNDQSPARITVQGRLTNSTGNPITVATNVTFHLYTQSSGGTVFYTETNTITPDSNGLFTYSLNGGNNFNTDLIQRFEDSVYLGITAGSDAEMTPRFLMTAAPYAMSLIPGAAINGAVEQSTQPYYGVLNGINSNLSDSYNAGLFGEGPMGIYGEARSDGTQDSYGGYFYNNNSAASGVKRYGAYGLASSGWGLYGESNNTSGTQQSAGVVGLSTDANGMGGVFTDTAATGTGVVATGAIQGLVASANGNIGNTSAGVFLNNSPASNANNVSVRANVNAGFGVYADSNGSSTQLLSAGVVGVSSDANGSGGVFTGTLKGAVAAAGTNPPTASNYSDGLTGLSSVTNGDGVYGHSTAASGYGVWGSAVNGTTSSLGGFFESYDGGASHVGIDVEGQGLATGGFLTGLDYAMMVRYNGSDTLHPGDVLALDGSAATFNGAQVLGTVKGNANNAGAAVGVAKYRFIVFTPQGKPVTVQADDKATAFHKGDLIEVVVLGQAQMKVSGAASVGDRLGLGSDGSIAATKDSTNSIGKIAVAPDANGNATVFVNFK